MNKHTPGPWIKGTLEWVGSNGRKVVVSDGPSFGSKSQWPDAEANSSLITAAPDLLEALDMCMRSMKSVLPDFNPFDQAAYDLAVASIAKARGEA